MNNRIITSMRAKVTLRQFAMGFVALLIFFCSPQIVLAAFPVTISPAVIDGEAKAREILRYKVTITNDSKQLLTLYPWARDVDQLGEDTKTSGLDPTTSLLSWLEFSRSEIVVPAGESIELPILVQVNLRAEPGNYHAVFRVSDGPNRIEAEHDLSRTASIDINVRILDDANERLQLGVFSSEKNLFVGDDASFGFRLDNTGNRGIVPTGKIRIFDRKGEEIDEIPVNTEQEKIDPDTRRQLASVWQSGGHFGKYKAMLDVSYGKTGTIQDTVFFWVLPWKKLLSFFLTLAIVSTIIALLIHSYVASGGKKLAVVRERFSVDDEPEEEGQEPTIDSEELTRIGMYARIKNALRRTGVSGEDPAVSQINALKEVPAPPPQRTRYSVINEAETIERVHLAPRIKKQHIDPAHIVRLKK